MLYSDSVSSKQSSQNGNFDDGNAPVDATNWWRKNDYSCTEFMPIWPKILIWSHLKHFVTCIQSLVLYVIQGSIFSSILLSTPFCYQQQQLCSCLRALSLLHFQKVDKYGTKRRILDASKLKIFIEETELRYLCCVLFWFRYFHRYSIYFVVSVPTSCSNYLGGSLFLQLPYRGRHL